MIHIDLVGFDETQIYETIRKVFLLTAYQHHMSYNRHILRSDNVLDDDDGDY